MKKPLTVFLCVGLALVLAGTALASQPIVLVVNSRQLFPDVPPQIVDGRIMVPLRVVAENLGAKVEWNDANRTVWVTTPPPPELYTKLTAIPWLHDQTKAMLERIEKPLEISGPEDFTNEVEQALLLLRDKAPDAYWSVETYLARIALQDRTPNSLEKATAYLDPKSNSCIFYNPDFYKTLDQLVFLFEQRYNAKLTRTMLIAETIVHEATHAQLNYSQLTSEIKFSDDEFIADLVAYRTLEKLGAPKAYLDLLQKVAVDNYLYK